MTDGYHPERKALEAGPPIPELVETMQGHRAFLANLVEAELDGMNGRVVQEMCYKGQEINAVFSYVTQAVFIGGMLLVREIEHEAPVNRDDFVRHEMHGFRFEIDFTRKPPTNVHGVFVAAISNEGDAFVQMHRRTRSDSDPFWLVDNKKDDYAQVDRETGKLLSQLAKRMLDGNLLRLVGAESEKEVIKLARRTQASFLGAIASDDRMSKLNARYLAEELKQQFVGVPMVAQVAAAYSLGSGREVHAAFSPTLFVGMDPVQIYVPSIELMIVEPLNQGGRRFKKLVLPGRAEARVIEGRVSPTGKYENTPKAPTEQDYEAFVEVMNHPDRELIVV